MKVSSTTIDELTVSSLVVDHSDPEEVYMVCQLAVKSFRLVSLKTGHMVYDEFKNITEVANFIKKSGNLSLLPSSAVVTLIYM